MKKRRPTAQDLIDKTLLEDYTYYLEETEEKKWFWVLISGNGRIIADSEQCYTSKESCKHGLRMVRNSKNVTVIERPLAKPEYQIDDV